VRSGDRARAEAILERLESSQEYVSPGELAILPAALGQTDRALALLEQAYRAHDLTAFREIRAKYCELLPP
jgi:hypothetical protein